MSDDPAPPPVLEATDVTVRQEGNLILDRVSLSVGEKSLHAVMGPNGAGKSTLIAALLGQIPFEGRVVCNFRREGRIGYVPQGFAVDRTMPVTVAEFLAAPRQRLPICFGVRPATRDKVASLLDRVALKALMDRRLGALSGGELRRVLVANAIDPRPELLVLDEPGSGLDVESARKLEDILLALRDTDEASILLVSHDPKQVRRLADHVTVLDRKAKRTGPIADIGDEIDDLLSGGAPS